MHTSREREAVAELREGRIRDPVHGYISFTAAEALLLDDPLVQRLRYIRQSSAAQFVFPGMNVSRFEHSLGAMHLASWLYRSAVAHAPEWVAAHLLSDLDALVGDDLADFGDEDTEQDLRAELLRLEAALRQQGSSGLRSPMVRTRVTSMVVEQALRFASLLHDLGHLPFSHDFEYVLTKFFNTDPGARQEWPALAKAATTEVVPVHELIGHRLAEWLANRMRREITASRGDEFQRCVRIASRVAKDILLARDTPYQLDSSPRARAARWLNGLIAGEIDADRCDYILRDGAHHGIPGANFDLERLFANVSIAQDETGPGNWETVILPSGVSAAEEFLVARFRLYQWGVYHHKAQQMAASLREGLAELLSKRHPAAVQFLTDYNRLIDPATRVGRNVIEPLIQYDDNWWLSVFKGYIYPVPGSHQPALAADAVADMRTITYRGRGRPSLWKKATDLPQGELRALNDAVPTSTDGRRRWDEALAALKDDLGVIVVLFSFRPYRLAAQDGQPSASRLRVAWAEDGKERFEPLSQRSAIVESLYEAWKRSLQVLAFAPRTTEGEHVFAKLKKETLEQLLRAAQTSDLEKGAG